MYKADITCIEEQCPMYGHVINTVTGITEAEEDLFYESYGQGGEDSEDHCPLCGTLGLLQDPVEYDPAPWLVIALDEFIADYGKIPSGAVFMAKKLRNALKDTKATGDLDV